MRPYDFAAEDFDVTSARHVADPFDFYRRLRTQEPVFRSEELESHVLSRYSDVRSVFLSHDKFSSIGSLTAATHIDPDVAQFLVDNNATLATFLANVDQPLHKRLRRSVSRSFSPRSMSRIGPQIRALAIELIGELKPAGRADLVADFAAVLPARVTSRFLGIPMEDTAQVQQWVDDWFALFFSPMPVEQQHLRAAGYVKYSHYMHGLLAARRAEPREDFMSETIAAVADGGAELSDQEIVDIMTAISLGGNDTTGNQIAGLMYRLLAVPGAWKRVVADPSLHANAVEESIRLDSAGLGGFRVANEDIEVAGRTIPAGSRVFLSQDSANHDETVFEDPDVYVVDRPNAGDNIGFGVGIHHCLGAPLARLELRIVLEALASNLPSMRLIDDSQRAYRSSVVQRAMESLPVEWS
ncbi:cytochrome P450 [Nocardia jiangxiensis]|uniref:Cytochrome P450 n=1 Tax=Nocardia jiangxiensis TaxID=282685 RepID=A0ABW6S0D9_9NOCA